MQTFIIVILCFIIFAQDIMHRLERKDLYNRIMAQDLDDYKHEKIKPKTVKCGIRKNHDGRRDTT
jgi:hypothetical protein